MEFVNGGNFVEWNVQKSHDENDTLVIRYSNVDQYNKSCELYINGNKLGQFAFAPTLSAWETEKNKG
jgi:hypothetical protein